MSTVPGSNKLVWTGRVISGLCVLFFAIDGVAKQFMPPEVVKACTDLGLPERIVPGIGILLLACVAVYAVPATAVLGAILLTGYLGGAIMTHVRVGGDKFPILFATVFGILIWLGLFLREPRLRALIPIRRPGA